MPSRKSGLVAGVVSVCFAGAYYRRSWSICPGATVQGWWFNRRVQEPCIKFFDKMGTQDGLPLCVTHGGRITRSTPYNRNVNFMLFSVLSDAENWVHCAGSDEGVIALVRMTADSTVKIGSVQCMTDELTIYDQVQLRDIKSREHDPNWAPVFQNETLMAAIEAFQMCAGDENVVTNAGSCNM